MIENKLKNPEVKKLRAEVVDLKRSLMNLRFQKSTGQLEKTAEIKKNKNKDSKTKNKYE
ncbi:50S ribosomal protein L29 [Pelagibacterales bacterium SAG-MED31]|nr:50S ribosomal protein L29 [Pelagibacterales bacterium SAG-MED31]